MSFSDVRTYQAFLDRLEGEALWPDKLELASSIMAAKMSLPPLPDALMAFLVIYSFLLLLQLLICGVALVFITWKQQLWFFRRNGDRLVVVNVRVLMIMTVIAECIAGIIDGIARIAAQKGSMSEHWTILVSLQKCIYPWMTFFYYTYGMSVHLKTCRDQLSPSHPDSPWPQRFVLGMNTALFTIPTLLPAGQLIIIGVAASRFSAASRTAELLSGKFEEAATALRRRGLNTDSAILLAPASQVFADLEASQRLQQSTHIIWAAGSALDAILVAPFLWYHYQMLANLVKTKVPTVDGGPSVVMTLARSAHEAGVAPCSSKALIKQIEADSAKAGTQAHFGSVSLMTMIIVGYAGAIVFVIFELVLSCLHFETTTLWIVYYGMGDPVILVLGIAFDCLFLLLPIYWALLEKRQRDAEADEAMDNHLLGTDDGASASTVPLSVTQGVKLAPLTSERLSPAWTASLGRGGGRTREV